MVNGLEGSIALVTGGGSGIGRATALAFARERAIVIIADIDRYGGEKTASQIIAIGGEAYSITTDVTNAIAVDKLITHIAKTWGRLDCACNNAGITGRSSSWQDLSEDEWSHVVAINLTGVWLCMKAEFHQMAIQGRGTIVNMASIFGLVGNPTNPAYTATKHGIIGLTKSGALAYAQAGIRVNAICPAYIDNPMTQRIFSQYPQREDAIIARHPIGRLGTSEEVAEAVVWLCSDFSSFITGHTLVIDGGYTVQ